MKIIFKTFENVPYKFEPISRKISLFESQSYIKLWQERKIFGKMVTPSKEEVEYKIKNEQQMLQLNITEDCSNRCSYCVYSGGYLYERTHSKRTMKFEIIQKAIDMFFKQSNKTEKIHISFYGGEPLMDKPWKIIKKTINYVNRNKPSKPVTFGLTTNGRHIDDEKIGEFIKNKFMLMVSIDGPEEIHDRYRRSIDGKSTFKEIVSNLERIALTNKEYYKNNIGFICTLVPPLKNWRKVRDFFNTESLVKDNNLIVSFVNLNDHKLPFKMDSTKLIIDIIELYRETIKIYYENAIKNTLDKCNFQKALLNKNLGLLHLAQKQEGNSEIPLNGCCIPGVRRCFVNTDGFIYACEKIAGFYPIGEISQYVDINKSYLLLSKYKDISEINCSECWAGNICDLCFISAREGSNFNKERKNFSCLERLNFFKAIIRLYASLKQKGGTELLNKIMPTFVG